MEQLEALDMQVLLGLLNNAPEYRTVTRIARALKTEKHKVNSSNILSMANEGFEHPCTLIVKDGVGEIKLRVTSMSAKSKINDQFLSGYVTNLKYYIARQFANAVWDGECYTIPADAIRFVNIGDSMGQILHGTVCVQMECTVGVQHMPTSRAMFTLLI